MLAMRCRCALLYLHLNGSPRLTNEADIIGQSIAGLKESLCSRPPRAGKSLNFASPDSGKGREKENNRACDMPLQADSVFFVSSLSSPPPPPPSPLSCSSRPSFFSLPPPFFTPSFCSLSVFVRLTSSETPVSMGTNKTHAFVRNLEQFVAPRRRTIGKLVRRFLNFFYYILISNYLLFFSLSLFFYIVELSHQFLLPLDISLSLFNRIIIVSTWTTRYGWDGIIISGQGHEVREPLGNRITFGWCMSQRKLGTGNYNISYVVKEDGLG